MVVCRAEAHKADDDYGNTILVPVNAIEEEARAILTEYNYAPCTQEDHLSAE